MQFVLTTLALLLGANARIAAPEHAAPGEYILFDGSASVGSLTWNTDPGAEVFRSDDGKKILVVATKRRCKVRLTAKDTAGTSSDVAVVEIGDSPEPAPKPDTPKPAPPVPLNPKSLADGKFKVAQPCCDRACQIRTDQRKAEAELVAKHLAELRNKIKSDARLDLTNLQVMRAEVMKATGSLPSALKHRWIEWAQWWGTELSAQSIGGKLATAADWCLFIDETILGLKAVM